MTRTRIVIVGLLAAGLAPGAPAVAASGATGSIKIGIPRHIEIGKPYTIRLTGYTSHPKSSVTMFAQRSKCAKQESKVPGNAGIVFPGGIATAHFKFSDRISYPTASHGKENYCAYLYYSPPPFTKEITIAHASATYRVPS